jgi:hypothetical protein
MVFAAEDGLWGLGNAGVIASTEDQKLQIENAVMPLSSEINNFWEDYVISPNPNEVSESSYSSYVYFCRKMAFDTGLVEIKAGDKIWGNTSKAEARVVHITVTGGTWNGATKAYGYLYVDLVSGTWQNN